MKILLADDEKTIAVTLGDALRAAGHSAVVVGDGDSATRSLPVPLSPSMRTLTSLAATDFTRS